MTRIVLPGDFITDNFLVVSTQAPRLVGYGLQKREDGIYAVNAGILHEHDNKLWLNTSMKRYIPHSGDRVLGTVTAKVGDIFRVDIGGPDLALLNYTSFEGATKRNRPNVKVGDLIYGQIILTSKHFEPELSCVDSESRARGMGVISTPGLVFSVTLSHARNLLKENDQIIPALGKELKFEITIGVNGRIWVGGEHSTTITVQRTRIAMKVHSFVRENFCTSPTKMSSKTTEQSCDNVKDLDVSDDVADPQNSTSTPSWKHFVYFMSQTRSWRKVFNHFIHCLASIYAVNISFTQVVIPLFSRIRYGEDGLYLVLLTAIFPSIIPGSVCLFIGIFYGLLHSWLSMFAEAMYFADRYFYSNWWSSRNMAYYYRSWNLVVHEWLYTYIYRDISNLLGSTTFGNALAQMSVFFISAVFHEYWFTVGLRMFYPIIFFLYFVIGGIIFLLSNLIKKPSSTWNVVLWWNLMLGTGIFFACYASEWYARQRCSKIYENDLLDLLIPRVWDCQHRLK
uniref:Ribosomal RNA-processing protein 40 n=1 Tax=Meloidogyne javanica TaxID=6303 RepID=A0A915M6Z2_MELJA